RVHHCRVFGRSGRSPGSAAVALGGSPTGCLATGRGDRMVLVVRACRRTPATWRFAGRRSAAGHGDVDGVGGFGWTCRDGGRKPVSSSKGSCRARGPALSLSTGADA